MSGNARILYRYPRFDLQPQPGVSDSTHATTIKAGITYSSQSNSNPASNVLLDDIGKKWLTDAGDLSNQWIRFDCRSAVTFDCFGIFAHNFTAGATVRLQANATDSWGSPTYNELLTLATDSDGYAIPRLVVFPSTSTFRYWRLFITDASNPDNRLKVGRIIAGSYYELSRNFTRGARFTHMDPSTRVVQVPGAIQIVDAGVYEKRFRQIQADFRWTDDTEALRWETIFARIGNSRPCVLCLDPSNDPSGKSAYCFLESPLSGVWKYRGKWDFLSLLFEEKTH